MSYFKWDKTLDTKVEDMNVEHKTLIDQMNKVYDCNKRSVFKSNTLLIELRKLQEVTQNHFEHEEKFMESINYNKLDTHKLIHKDLLSKLSNFIELQEGSEKPLPESFFHFLKYWLTSHIRGIDIKYGQFQDTQKSA